MGQKASTVKAAYAFLAGTHPVLGKESPVALIANQYQLIDILQMGLGDYEVGYKGFVAGGNTYRNFFFPLDGTTASLPIGTKPDLCHLGFHYCPLLKKVDEYFPFSAPSCDYNIYAEVCAYGLIKRDSKSGKSVANNMHVIRLLTKAEIKAAAEAVDPPYDRQLPGMRVLAGGAGFHNTDEDGRTHRDGGPAYRIEVAGQGFSEGWMQHGILHRNPKDGPARESLYMCYSEKTPVLFYVEHGHLSRPETDGPALTFGKRFFVYAQDGIGGRDTNSGAAMSLPCGLVVFMEKGKIHRDPAKGPAIIRYNPPNPGDWWCDWLLRCAMWVHNSDWIQDVCRAFNAIKPGQELYYVNGVKV